MSTYFCCPLCQLPSGSIGLQGSYQPVSGGNPISYQLCINCARDIAGASEIERAELLEKVELFFEKETCHERK